MLKTSTILAILFLLPMTTLNSQAPDKALRDRALALHKQSPLIDGHNDLPVGAP